MTEAAPWDLLATIRGDPVRLGLPPLDADSLERCNGLHGIGFSTCSSEEFIGEVRKYEPILTPNQKATYSNVNYSLLGVVLARVTNRTYEEVIQDLVLRPANMASSGFTKPDDSTGAIVQSPYDIGGESSWDWDEGAYNPTGGLFATANDLARYSRHILNDGPLARRWFKPASLTSHVGSYYGSPWEMFSSASLPCPEFSMHRLSLTCTQLPGCYRTLSAQ